MPNGEYIMDSMAINQKLDSLHPEPSLHLDLKVHEKIQKTLGAAIGPARGMIIPIVPRTVLREPSTSWFIKDREKKFGKTLDQYEKDEGGEAAWNATQSRLEQLKQEVSQHKRDDGPFVLGSAVSYSDIMIASVFAWIEKTDGDLFEKFVGYDESFKKLYEACRPWLARDDH